MHGVEMRRSQPVVDPEQKRSIIRVPKNRGRPGRENRRWRVARHPRRLRLAGAAVGDRRDPRRPRRLPDVEDGLMARANQLFDVGSIEGNRTAGVRTESRIDHVAARRSPVSSRTRIRVATDCASSVAPSGKIVSAESTLTSSTWTRLPSSRTTRLPLTPARVKEQIVGRDPQRANWQNQCRGKRRERGAQQRDQHARTRHLAHVLGDFAALGGALAGRRRIGFDFVDHLLVGNDPKCPADRGRAQTGGGYREAEAFKEAIGCGEVGGEKIALPSIATKSAEAIAASFFIARNKWWRRSRPRR